MTEYTELPHKLTGDVWRFSGAGEPSGHYKLRIPKGATLWTAVFQNFRYPETASILMSMDSPPVAASAVDMGISTVDALQRLWTGETLRNWSPENSGTLSVSQPGNVPGAWRADRDRWVFMDIVFPSGFAQNWQSHIAVDLAYAPEPAPAPAPTPPQPDLALAQRTLAYAHAAGLVAALMKTSGAQSDDELIDWVLLQGDLWFSICRLAGLAEKGTQA